MKDLFLIRDSLANKISYYHLMLLMASLPFNLFYSHLILISFTIHTLIQLDKKRLGSVFKRQTLILQSVFFVTLVSTTYTINRPEAFNEWGKQVTILLLPILFCLTSLDLRKYRSSLLLIFALVCTATIAYLYADALIVIKHYHLPLASLFSQAFTNHNFSEPIGMHATFFSMQVAVALVYLLTILLNERSNYQRLFYLVCVCILSAGIVQLSSKSVFVALFLIINLAIPFFLLNRGKRFKYVIVVASVSVLSIVGILTIGTFRVRYITDLRVDLATAPAIHTNDSRLDRWKSAAELIRQSPVIGHGAGSEISLLQDVFFTKKYYDSYLRKLNTHNEYLSFLVKSGVMGLLIYIGTLIFGFKATIGKKDLLFFTFMVLIVLVSLSENLLDVDKGVIFYAFFFSFFLFSPAGKSSRTDMQDPV